MALTDYLIIPCIDYHCALQLRCVFSEQFDYCQSVGVLAVSLWQIQCDYYDKIMILTALLTEAFSQSRLGCACVWVATQFTWMKAANDSGIWHGIAILVNSFKCVHFRDVIHCVPGTFSTSILFLSSSAFSLLTSIRRPSTFFCRWLCMHAHTHTQGIMYAAMHSIS